MWLRSKVIQNQIAWELSMGTSSWHWNSTCSSESDSRITSMEFPRQTRMIKAPNRRVSQWVLILGIGSWCKVIILNHTWPRVAGIQYVCLWSRWMYCFMLIFFRSSTTWPDTSASRRLNFQTPNTYRPSAASSFYSRSRGTDVFVPETPQRDTYDDMHWQPGNSLYLQVHCQWNQNEEPVLNYRVCYSQCNIQSNLTLRK